MHPRKTLDSLRSAGALQYKAAEQRVEKVDNTGTTRYVYDGTAIIADTDGTGVVKNYYLPGIGVVSSAGVQTYYRTNPLGSNIATTDASSNLLTRTEVDAYGIETFASTGSRTAFRFAGKAGYVTDDHSGLDLLGRRYYIPALGRFLTQDPKGHGAGLNLYRYCDDNPLTNLDPTGLDTWAIIAGDTKSPALYMHPYYAGLERGLKEFGDKVRSYDGPSKAEVFGIMTSNVDYVLFWGHGNRGMLWFDTGSAKVKGLEEKDILAIAAVRRAVGLGKMRNIEIDECEVCGNVKLRNALLQIAESVTGYEGETMNEHTHKLGVKRTYYKPEPVVGKGLLSDVPANYKDK